MRKLLSLVCLVVFLGLAMPAQAQLRSDVRSSQSPARLYGPDGPAFSLNKLFSPEHFRMSHTYEMSFGSFGGQTSSLGMYTNTMMFQFNQKLAARVDMAFAHSPFGNGMNNPLGPDADRGRVFLRNAEIAYRPSENMRLHLAFRQSPYGGYMNPYGYYGNPYYGYGSSFYGVFGTSDRDLFWNDRLR